MLDSSFLEIGQVNLAVKFELEEDAMASMHCFATFRYTQKHGTVIPGVKLLHRLIGQICKF